MHKKIEYKRDFKPLYMPPAMPVIVDVPEMPFIAVDGSGDPNGEPFGRAVEALYSLSYREDVLPQQ